MFKLYLNYKYINISSVKQYFNSYKNITIKLNKYKKELFI